MKPKKILIFAGAGASFAVDKHKYPTTAGFVERFPDDLKKNKLINNLIANFETKFGDKTADVEKILWCLDELITFCELPNDPKSPMSWLIPTNLLAGLVGASGDVSSFAVVARSATPYLKDLRDKINAHLYEIYGETPTPDSFSENWGLLLPELIKKGYWIDLITTNYDLVLEEVVDNIGLKIGYGQVHKAVPRLNIAAWKDFLLEEKLPYPSGLITKLHGSLNWERDRAGIVCSGTGLKSDHKHHVAIYPGFKGPPKDEPFSLLHDYFERVLQTADHIVFIGFAFRDDYINTLVQRAFHPNQFIVIDPSDLSQMPAALKERVHHIKEGFSKKSVEHLLHLT